MSAHEDAASSSQPSATRRSFACLAEELCQLIMQGLDFTSLARLASTCRQLRAEAMDREAGKFIPKPSKQSLLYEMYYISTPHPAHASPLFRKHAPMMLTFEGDNEAGLTPAEFEARMAYADTFSRITNLNLNHNPWWTANDRARWLLGEQCIRAVKTVRLAHTPLERPLQSALFGLPQLTFLDMGAPPTTALLPSAVALASKLVTLSVKVDRDPASVRAFRALRLAPALTRLFILFSKYPTLCPPVLPELICCLPPTLTDLTLMGLSVPHDLPRPQAKALFSRTPLLKSLELAGSIETVLRGLLDAGLPALPMLRRVHFDDVTMSDFSFEQDPDPIPPLLRRFLHRFPQVTVSLDILDVDWDVEELCALQTRYLLWPRVELYSLYSRKRFGAPLTPAASDDEDGSDVEEWSDPQPLESEADSNQSAN